MDNQPVSREKKPKFRVNVIKSRCKGCTFCVEFCPKKVFEMTKEFNSKGYYLPKVMRPEDCIGCQLCAMLCPEIAIFVEPEAKSKETAKGGKNGN